MGQLIVTEFVTLDGVMEAPGGEPTHPHTNWVSDHWADDVATFKDLETRDADALLLGRVTYESFAGAWPTYDGPMADKMNSMPKYVVSSTLVDPEWSNTTVVGADAAAAARRLRDEIDGTILVPGSGRLVHALLDAGVVDELRLMVFPVTIGGGLRVFPDTRLRQEWQPLGTRTFSNEVRLDTYVPVPAATEDTEPG